MVLSLLKSASETFTERIKSPFGGTLIAVFVLLNWKLFLGIIFFDDNYSFDNRISFIENYIAENRPWKLLLHPLWITFASLTGFLVLSYMAMAINLAFVKWAKPWIVSKIDRNSIATKEELDYYRKLNREKDAEVSDLDRKYHDEKNARKSADNERISMQGNINKLNLEIIDLKNRPFGGTGRRVELYQIFEGEWLNNHTREAGDIVNEEFQIDVNHEYIVKNSITPITIKNTFYDDLHKILYFEKHVKTTSNTKVLVNYLHEVPNNLFIGWEMLIDSEKPERIKIEYRPKKEKNTASVKV